MIRFAKILLPLLLPASFVFAASRKPSAFFNVKDYGAKGDGVSLDSKAINKAIDAAAGAGGGTVYLPAGNYLSGSVHLQSNISIFIDQGAVIIAAPVSADNGYDEEEPGPGNAYHDSGHSHWHNSLIWGENLHDVSIVGQGMIYGKGLYRDYVKDKQSANKAIALRLCRNVNIQDITIWHGGWFGILATGVDNLTISNIKEDTNRDGMDIDCCRNVHVSDCSVNSPYDDGICLKSSFALGGYRDTENVTITNCIVSGFEEGSFLNGTYKRTVKNGIGRIKFGTESNGGFKNITISNCVFNYCHGLALETVDGALLEDVTINNITMRDINNAAIFMRIGARMRGPAGYPIGELHRVIISNIFVYNADMTQGILISGVPGHPIEDVEIKDVKIYSKGGGAADLATRQVPELEKGYPEPESFGTLPAYGIFARHVDGLKLESFELHFENPDKRPPLVFDDVQHADIRFTDLPVVDGVAPVFQDNCKYLHIFESSGFPYDRLKSQ